VKRVLLISNSTLHGSGYLDHAQSQVCDFLGKKAVIAFVPFAMFGWSAYAVQAKRRLEAMGYSVHSLHEVSNPKRMLAESGAVFVGGGNTFRLLKSLYDFDLLAVIRRNVEQGMPYIGSSAGSIVACPTLKTTKDMPIVQPPSFEALRLVEFQISPHYLDPDPSSTHMGETQEERIRQFLEENDFPVVGLREGAMIRIEGESIELRGSAKARLFRRGHSPSESSPGEEISELLQEVAVRTLN
jgi:dipeptidase E